jgi:hypothetical protein
MLKAFSLASNGGLDASRSSLDKGNGVRRPIRPFPPHVEGRSAVNVRASFERERLGGFELATEAARLELRKLAPPAIYCLVPAAKLSCFRVHG